MQYITFICVVLYSLNSTLESLNLNFKVYNALTYVKYSEFLHFGLKASSIPSIRICHNMIVTVSVLASDRATNRPQCFLLVL